MGNEKLAIWNRLEKKKGGGNVMISRIGFMVLKENFEICWWVLDGKRKWKSKLIVTKVSGMIENWELEIELR